MADLPPKKLLIVITKSNYGGAQRYVFDLARSLTGYDITVACGGEGILVDKLEAANIRIITLSSLGRDVSIFKDGKAFFSLISLIRAEKPDIIHLNSSKIGIMGAVAAFLTRSQARTIFTAHAWAFNEDRGFISKSLITTLHWLTVFLCDKTIAVSEGVRKQVLHLPRIAHKISVVHLGIDKPIFYGKKNARTVLGIPEKAFAIGTIAELHPVKGLVHALDAVAELPFPCSYTIIGQGDEKAKLEKHIAKNPALQKTTKLAGFIPDAAALLPAFDVFLLPSISEALGYVLIEAGYAKLPVVATSVGGIPEIIQDMQSGVLIHPQSSKEIRRALTFLYDDEPERARLGTALAEQVQGKFSLARMVEGTVRIYEGV
jgi:glycosyltransferase involved in cell wall biosynthesis